MTESTDVAALRQTGAEEAPRKCPSCGTPMQVTESGYGSVVAVCPRCREKDNAEPRQKANAQTSGSLQREQGTAVTNQEQVNG